MVGGSIYDRVWRIELSSPRILVAKLVGATGAELGLYLFDENADSILNDVPIASSSLPGGSQRLYLPLQSGTYYVDVNGRNPTTPYAFTLSLSLLEDRTPPALNITLADGIGRISTAQTSVVVDARDALSGVSDMRYAIDGGSWGNWFPYGPVVGVEFPAVEGQHRIAVQARNPLGLESIVVEESVFLDLTAPTAEIVGPLSDVTTLARPTFTYRFSEAMSNRSVLNGGVQVFAAGRDPVAGTAIYDSATRTVRFTPRNSLTPGMQYLFQVGSATDVAGNFVQDPIIRPITRMVPTRVSLVTRGATNRGIASTTIVATTAGLPSGYPVLIERLASADPLTGETEWIAEGTATVAARSVRAKVRPSETSRYRFRFAGDAGHTPASSLPFSVTVRPTLRLIGTNMIRQVNRGDTFTIRGSVAPPGATVSLLLYRCGSAFDRCVRANSFDVAPDALGNIEYEWVAPNTRGRWAWRIKVAASTAFLASSSTLLRITVK
jgi:hypothetical protein